MSEHAVSNILERVGAIITDSHLVYTSGRHGSSYVNKDALYPHIKETSFICAQIAAEFAGTGVEIVAGPTIGGVIMAQWVAYHLEQRNGQPVLAVYAEEDGSGETRQRVFRRGYGELLQGRRVLIVEDILTTGISARLVVDAVRANGGEPLGVGALCNRGGVTAETLAVPQLLALVEVPLQSFAAAECPLCRAGVPVETRVGKGAAFLESKELRN
jgi:orotate phosphoribosyltransferase